MTRAVRAMLSVGVRSLASCLGSAPVSPLPEKRLGAEEAWRLRSESRALAAVSEHSLEQVERPSGQARQLRSGARALRKPPDALEAKAWMALAAAAMCEQAELRRRKALGEP